MGEKTGIREMQSRMVRDLRSTGVDSRRAEQIARNCALRHTGEKPGGWRGDGDFRDRPRDGRNR